MTYCKYCDQTKENSAFRKHSRKCKRCQADYTAKYRSEHPEQCAKTHRAWLSRNKEHLKLYNRQRYFSSRYKRSKNHIAKNKEWVNRNREKRNAAAAVQRAVTMGKLAKPTHCELCNQPAYLVGHHEDYSKRLEVKWICQSCHRYIHKLSAQLSANHESSSKRLTKLQSEYNAK